ncbi:methyltransferase domain-containing protein [Nocardioides bigeumensis]|jgi:SAM-dependent methyltransferase|uniref:Methyltransferase n=1 Tax=Nocardioides bigeumensis TaxID=433657 RepID=A0ABN2XU84_9ACTN
MSARTAVVWAAVQRVLEQSGSDAGPARILDIGGGTGGFAVRLAALGHRVTVVDPSPDALAALSRRAAESGVTDLVTGIQGDLSDLGAGVGSLVDESVDEPLDLVLCHGVLEVVPDPRAALTTLRDVLRPGGNLSLLVAQRHAAVVARAMAGHFQQALALLEGHDPASRTGRRFTREELAGADGLLANAGFEVAEVLGVRVFADLVPGSLLDLEPGATAALVELEQAVARRSEYLPLATQLHLLAH